MTAIVETAGHATITRSAFMAAFNPVVMDPALRAEARKGVQLPKNATGRRAAQHRIKAQLAFRTFARVAERIFRSGDAEAAVPAKDVLAALETQAVRDSTSFSSRALSEISDRLPQLKACRDNARAGNSLGA